MTDEIFEKESETADPIDVPAVEDAPAEVFTEADVEARLSEARLSWEAERERETAAAAVMSFLRWIKARIRSLPTVLRENSLRRTVITAWAVKSTAKTARISFSPCLPER